MTMGRRLLDGGWVGNPTVGWQQASSGARGSMHHTLVAHSIKMLGGQIIHFATFSCPHLHIEEYTSQFAIHCFEQTSSTGLSCVGVIEVGTTGCFPLGRLPTTCYIIHCTTHYLVHGTTHCPVPTTWYIVHCATHFFLHCTTH